MSNRRKLIVAALFLVLLYLLSGILLAPFVVRHFVLPKVQAALIPELTVAKIRTNPILLSATLSGIELKDDANGEFLKLEKAHARVSFATFWRFHPVVAEIELTRPGIFLLRAKDTSLNWENLLVPTTPAPDKPVAAELPKLTLKHFSVIEGNLEVIDQSPTSQFEQSLGPVSFEVRDLTSAGTEAGTHRFSATTPDGASIEWHGTLNPSELSVSGSVVVTGFALHHASPYLVDLLGLELRSASMSVSMTYEASFKNDALSILLSEGTYHLHSARIFDSISKDPVASIDDLWIHEISAEPLQQKAQIGFIEMAGIEGHFKDTEKKAAASMANGSIVGIKLDNMVATIESLELAQLTVQAEQKTEKVASALDAFSIRKLSFDLNQTRLVIDSVSTRGSTSTLTRTKPAQSSEPSANPVADSSEGPLEANEPGQTPEAKPVPYALELASLTWSDVHLILDDQTVAPAADLRLTDLRGEITGLSNDPAARATLHLSANVLGKAPLVVSGNFNPFPGLLFMDITLDLQGVDVTAASPYAGQFLGRGLAGGGFTFELENRIEDSQLKGSASVLLDQLELGDKVDSPEAIKLPLDLALILFRDANGKITFNDVAINGDLSQPGFSYPGILAQAFGNLITKAVTAPFRFLSSSLGGPDSDSERAGDPSRVTFETGSTTVGANDFAVQTAADFYQKRPLLNYEIQGFYTEAEREALTAAELEKTLRAEWSSRPATIRDSFVLERPRILRRLAEKAGLAQVDADGNTLSIDDLTVALQATIVINDTDLLNLADERARAVQQALVDRGMAKTDLFLLAPDATTDESPYVHLGIRP